MKFDVSRLSRSRDMVGAHPNLNGSGDLTTVVVQFEMSHVT